ncbi:MmcQ/YjbR family DNA-binding protein [Longispora albida]|uniref:MmcQ/YjbR family DNA-binding protein n=1 Tax=Longispora albida TaxID=203523 RepID=UPI0003669AEF|nr:MmcQ/YjbR family DNA-binding protein [Longispora albida]
MAVTFEQVKAWCLDLPGAAEELTWEVELTFRVQKKIFAMGTPTGTMISVKASREDQEELIASDGETYRFAPYVGRFGWVQVNLPTADPDELRDVITEAWRRTAPKKLVRAFDAENSQQ